MTITSDQLDRLPKYAREHIFALERRIERFEQSDQEVTDHATGIEWSDSHDWQARHALPIGSTLWFGKAPGRVQVRVTHDGEIRVSADDWLVIQPKASNSIIVENKR